MGKRTAKEKPFWKKKQLEQEASISTHIGKLIDRLSFDDMLALGIGVAGYAATKTWQGTLAAIIGYKLATTDGIISQASGLGTLSTLGLIGLINMGYFSGEERLKIEPEKPDLCCPTDYDLRWAFVGGWYCAALKPGLPPVEPYPCSEV